MNWFLDIVFLIKTKKISFDSLVIELINWFLKNLIIKFENLPVDGLNLIQSLNIRVYI